MRCQPSDMPPVREFRTWLVRAASHDAPPLIQFVKYGMAGVLAMGTDLLVFTLANLFLFPIGEAAESVTRPLADYPSLWAWMDSILSDPRVANYLKCNLTAFFFANAVAYVLNVKWVFRAGRHRRHLEITLFLLVSVVSFLLGSALGAYLVGRFGMNEYLAKGGNIVAAILINYLCRKFWVFKG
ncbi:MAG: GtrA family protein [Verrucomicrobia bacterium]|nr:GtrA family protein [Verrucomicrobiota bacterium]MCH8525834.1 GtrA family protein [Kiritimatiellia bacterium]